MMPNLEARRRPLLLHQARPGAAPRDSDGHLNRVPNCATVPVDWGVRPPWLRCTAPQRMECSSPKKIGDREWSMNLVSSICSTLAAAAPSGVSAAATTESRLSNHNSAIPSKCSGAPRPEASAPLIGPGVVCSCTYLRISRTAASEATNGPCTSRQYRWNSASSTSERRWRQNTSLTTSRGYIGARTPIRSGSWG